MTVGEYIKTLDSKKILDGKYAFKVFKDDSPYDKWYFYCDQKENPANSVDSFCNHDGIKDCMRLEVYVVPEYEKFSQTQKIFLIRSKGAK